MSASTTVTFSTSSSSDNITVETDGTLNVDSSGNTKSTFSYGESAYFRVYAADLNSLAVSSTSGTITDHGIQQSTRDAEDIQFVDSQTNDYNFPILGVASFSWYGRDLGAVTKSGSSQIQCETAPDASNGIIGLASVAVTAQYRLFSITVPVRTDSEFPVLIDVRTA